MIVVESNGSTAVSESGTTDTLTVVLDTQPITNVVVSVTGSDASEATLSTSTIVFTPQIGIHLRQSLLPVSMIR